MSVGHEATRGRSLSVKLSIAEERNRYAISSHSSLGKQVRTSLRQNRVQFAKELIVEQHSHCFFVYSTI